MGVHEPLPPNAHDWRVKLSFTPAAFLFLFSHQVLWKPLLEAAAVIRGAGWVDMKAGESGGSDVHGPASRAGGGADNDASVKRRTLTMKFYTQLKEDDDAFDTEV
jgi:hypothetical protein